MVPEIRAWGAPLPNGTVTGLVGLVARREAQVAVNELSITGDSFLSLTYGKILGFIPPTELWRNKN